MGARGISLQGYLCQRIAETLARAPIHDHLGYEALAHLKMPGPGYLETLATLHKAIKPKLYIEIGVRDGDSLRQTQTGTKCIAIDPEPRCLNEVYDQPGTPAWWSSPDFTFAICTSGQYFAREENRERARGFDLAFIDGSHNAVDAARDFMELWLLSKPTSIIVLHDVIPMDAHTANPICKSSFWTGDVWRLMAGLVASDFHAFTIACPPTGLGVVCGKADSWGLCNDPLDMDWGWLSGILNIVPNDGKAIAEAFSELRDGDK
jgi:hypothetical protein